MHIAFTKVCRTCKGGDTMKHLAALFCMVCAIALPLQGYAADPGNIYLRYLEGDVQVKTVDANEWLPASINMPLSDSDQIWVPDNGRAELFLRNGTIVRLDRNTFLEMPAPGDNQARLYLGEGRLYGNVVVEKGNAVILETPAASFIARTNSAFRIDVAENEDTAASVLQGELYADRGTGQMRIGAGERMALKKDAQYPVLAKLLQADEWEQWNKQRDREFARPELVNTTAYLPDELKSYSYDLNKNGKWVYEQEYGYVWTPTVMVVQEWSPYRVGRWVWMRGDYVWISYEPWGWVPYHYGRWAFIKARGWCWVPPRRGFAYWGPGYVGWVHTPTCVSWVPLAPREVYYGRGYYGPYSVNIKNVTVQNITVNRPAYKNIHVNNAITAVHRDTFVAGRQVKPTPKENLFLKERKIMAAPEIRPEKATLMPVVKDIPKAKQPPARIASLESGTSNQLKRTDERRAGMPQRTYNAPAGPRKENPATGSQAVQRISRPPTQSSRTSLQRGTPRGNEVPSTTGQLTSTRYVRTESQRIGAVNKAPAAPVARQETRAATGQGRAPEAAKQARPSLQARTQPPSVTSLRTRQAPTTPALTQRTQASSIVRQRTRSPAATSQTLPATRPSNVKPPSAAPPMQPSAKTPSATPQAQLNARSASATPQSQSQGKEGMQISATPRGMTIREAAPRAERKGGR